MIRSWDTGWSLVSELGSVYTPLHPGEQARVVQSGSTLWSMKGRKTGWGKADLGQTRSRGPTGHLTLSSITAPHYKTIHALLDTFKHHRKLRSLGNKSPKALIQTHGTSLVVQGLRCCTLNAEGLRSVSGWGIRFYMLQLKILHATNK